MSKKEVKRHLDTLTKAQRMEKELRKMTQEVAVHEATLYHVFNLSSAKDIKQWVCKRLGHPADMRCSKRNTCFCGAKKRRCD